MIVGGVVCGTWARKGDELTVTWLDETRRPTEAIEREAEPAGRHPRRGSAPEPEGVTPQLAVSNVAPSVPAGLAAH